jgi:hypothetical protein
MYICPVCGYPQLAEPPRSPSGGGSYEICPSCGFQFGVDDDDRGKTYEGARKAWQEAGMPWSSKGIPAPKGWNGPRQPLALNPAKKTAKKFPPRPAAKSAKKAAKAAAKKAMKKPAKKISTDRAKKPVQTAKKKGRNHR